MDNSHYAQQHVAHVIGSQAFNSTTGMVDWKGHFNPNPSIVQALNRWNASAVDPSAPQEGPHSELASLLLVNDLVTRPLDPSISLGTRSSVVVLSIVKCLECKVTSPRSPSIRVNEVTYFRLHNNSS